MKVTTYCMNKGQPSQYFGLISLEGNVLHSAPNNWKTEQGALRWAKKNGYDISTVKKSNCKSTSKTTSAPKIQQKPSARKPRKTMFAPGVILRNSLYVEDINGKLVGTLTLNMRDAHLYASRAGALARATVIASRFPRSDKAQAVVSRVNVEV